MGQNISRAALDGLLAKTHVEHALVQPDDNHNDIPTSLATVVYLDGTPDDLRATYESQQAGLLSWSPSPENITDKEGRAQFLGDERFQRAYLTYFSMENGRLAGNARALAMCHLLTGAKPLIYGLFGGLGRPLVFLSDGMELQTAVMVVESLTLAAVDWIEPIYDILTTPQVPRQAQDFSLPAEIIGRLAYDGRFSGIMKSGPGFLGVSQVFANTAAKAAIVDYLHQLDCRDPVEALEQISRHSVLLLCATHKPAAPAFDFYLSHIPTLINSVRVLLVEFEEAHHQVLILRGLWLLVILLYITQLRPVVNPQLLFSVSMPPQHLSWHALFEQLRRRDAASRESVRDMQLLRTLRSLWELGKADGEGGRLHLQAAWKLTSQWKKWAGREGEREETLNIRL
ncbi:oxidoreductase AflY [Rhypophila decipiens]